MHSSISGIANKPHSRRRLQNGRFDAPDRLFGGLREAWESVTANAADFKELVPEFFLPGDGAFLVNRHRLALGTKQNGCGAEARHLPPPAKCCLRA